MYFLLLVDIKCFEQDFVLFFHFLLFFQTIISLNLRDNSFVGEEPKDANSMRRPNQIDINIDENTVDNEISNKFTINSKNHLDGELSKYLTEKKNLITLLTTQTNQINRIAMDIDETNKALLYYLNKNNII